MYTEVCSENVKGRYHLENLDVDGTIILKWILVKWYVRMGAGFSWLRTGTSGGLL
jgi:hypothetical protein